MLHSQTYSNFSYGSLRMHKSNMKAAIAQWLQDICDAKRLSPRALALAAKVSPSTIYRALDMDSEFTPTTKTVEKIAARLGVPTPEANSNVSTSTAFRGFAEGELSEIVDQKHEGNSTGNDQSWWVLNNDLLELSGLLPGDKIVVDMSIEPVPGDIVCAQIYNFKRGTAETVLRIYEPPYLMTHSLKRLDDVKPLLIDNERVAVMGTMIKMTRERNVA